MKQRDLNGKKVAILATDGFEESELTEPLTALRKAGAEVEVVSLERGEIQGFEHLDKGERVAVDRTVSEAKSDHYDALVIPGGLYNPDKLRTNEEVRAFTRRFFAEGKPVAAICHGPWVLIDAELIEGRKVTSWPAIRKDVENAGGRWVDEEVVVDRGLVTSRSPKDLAAFCAKLLEEIDEGRHVGQRKAAAG